jgi:Chitin synthase N-terminal
MDSQRVYGENGSSMTGRGAAVYTERVRPPDTQKENPLYTETASLNQPQFFENSTHPKFVEVPQAQYKEVTRPTEPVYSKHRVQPQSVNAPYFRENPRPMNVMRMPGHFPGMSQEFRVLATSTLEQNDELGSGNFVERPRAAPVFEEVMVNNDNDTSTGAHIVEPNGFGIHIPNYHNTYPPDPGYFQNYKYPEALPLNPTPRKQELFRYSTQKTIQLTAQGNFVVDVPVPLKLINAAPNHDEEFARLRCSSY